MSEQAIKLPVLVLVRDLMFSSRITSTAASCGVAYKVIRDPLKLAGESGERLLVDLNLPGAIAAAAQWRAQTGQAVVGFVAHVDVDAISEARAAGIDRVIARGQFVQILDRLLTEPIAKDGTTDKTEEGGNHG